MAELKAMAMLNAKSLMLNILGDTLSEVKFDMMVDTVVERQARVVVNSLELTLVKKKKEVLLDTLAAWLSEV